MTTVVNLHTVRNVKKWMRGKNNIYIGRGTNYLPASKWANPYKLSDYDRETAVALYVKQLLGNKELLNCLNELRGKNLGCYCVPKLCHGLILKRLVLSRWLQELEYNVVQMATDMIDCPQASGMIDSQNCSQMASSGNIEKIMEELSETIRNPTDGFLEDTEDIVSHINNDRFSTPVKPKKRTGKAKNLLDEQFVFDVPIQNPSGRVYHKQSHQVDHSDGTLCKIGPRS